MGAYQSIYLGPYLEVPHIPGIKIEAFKKCDNPECKVKKRLEAKFCPECGVATAKHTIEHPTKVNPASKIDDDEMMWDVLVPQHNGGCNISDDATWYLPNNHSKLEEYIISLDDYVGGVDISDMKAEEGKAKFAEVYAKWIDKIKEAGGEPIICYGIFISWA